MKQSQWMVWMTSAALCATACGGSTPEAGTPSDANTESAESESPLSDEEFWAQEAEASENSADPTESAIGDGSEDGAGELAEADEAADDESE